MYLFLLTPAVVSQLHGLPTLEFLCVLEQYMFMHFFPAVNGSRVATAGVLQSPDAIARLRAAIGNEVHVYLGLQNDPSVPLVHVATYPSAGSASTDLLDYERLGVRNIIRRGG